MVTTSNFIFSLVLSITPWFGQSFTVLPMTQFLFRSTSTLSSLSKDSTNNNQDTMKKEEEILLDPTISSQFKIVTCSSTSCRKRMNSLGLDEYAILSGLYQRKEIAGAPEVTVEESSCLGGCKVGPCVGVEHEDYFGTVSLEGMEPNEFNDSIFHK